MFLKKILSLNNFFLLVIFCAPLYLLRVTVFGLPSNVFELLAALAIILSITPKKSFVLNKLPSWLFLSLLLMLGGVLFSLFSSESLLLGFGILKSWFVLPILFSFMLYTRIDSMLYLEKIFLSIYLSSTLIGTVSLVYKFFGIATYDNRLTAFYLSPNHLAMSLAPGVFFGLYFLLKYFSQENYSKKVFFQLILILTTLIIPLYYTYSYGGWLAIIVSSIAMLSLTISSKSYLKLILFFIFIGAILLVLQFNTEKFSTLKDFSSRSSFASRQTIWKVSKILILENPISGIGPGNFQSAYIGMQPRFEPYLEWAVPQPHNIFLAFWLQSSIFGLLGFVLLLFFIFRIFFSIFRNKKNTALAAPLFGFFLYTILHGLIDTTYWKNDLSFLFWICTMLVLFLYARSKKGFYN